MTMKDDHELTVTRVIDAPRELIFTLFTDPKHLDKWWGAGNMHAQTAHMNAKTGGSWEYEMKIGSGKSFPNYITYKEIQRPEKIVYSYTNDKSTPEDQKPLTVILLSDLDGKTKLDITLIFPSDIQFDNFIPGAVRGLNGNLDSLEEYLKKID